MTKTELANLALIRSRESRLSDDVDSSNHPNAELIRDLWKPALRITLKKVRPQFAQAQATPAKLTEVPKFEWDLSYQLPTDYVEMVKFNGLDYGEYEELYDIFGNKLYTDEDPVYLKYIRYEENVGLFDDEFVEALAYKLAYDIVGSNRGSVNLQQELYKQFIILSMESNASSGHSRKLPPIRDRVTKGGRLMRARRRRSTNETSE